MSSKPTLRHAAFLAIGVFSLFLIAATDPQCARVDDRVTSPDVSLDPAKGTVAQCVKSCVEAAKSERDHEQDLHQANIEACGGDYDCLEQEEARHEAAMEQIAMDERACKSPCHEQGGGGGGQ